MNAYLNVSCFVAQFSEYFPSMVNHLAFIKLKHWEPAIRELAAQSLAAITPLNPDYVVKEILPKLVDSCLDKALHVRHGAILGVAEILVGLSGNSHINKHETLDKAFKSLSIKEIQLIADSDYRGKFAELYQKLSTVNYIPVQMPEGSPIHLSVRDIIPNVEKQRLYRGKGGEIMRNGVCHLIKAMAIANV